LLWLFLSSLRRDLQSLHRYITNRLQITPHRPSYLSAMLMEVTAATGVLVLILLVALAAMEEITAPAVTGMAAVMITALATAPLTVMVPETVTAAVMVVTAVAMVVVVMAAVRNQAAESN
jgi:zinc transporter ZupT